MKITDYITIVEQTAVFPQSVENFGVCNAYLGLIDEMDEVNKATKAMRWKDGQDPSFRTVRAKNLAKECGDVLWYVTAMCRELSIDPVEVLSMNDPILFKFDEGVIPGMIKKFYRDGKPIGS